MNQVTSPEICLRYCWGVSDLVDPYFQTIVLNQRLTVKEDERVKATISCWTMLLSMYTVFFVTAATVTLLIQMRFAEFLNHGLIGSILGFLCASAAAALAVGEIYMIAKLTHHLIRYDLIFPVKYIGVSKDGIRLLSNFLGRGQRQFVKWEDITDVKIGIANFLDPLTDTRQIKHSWYGKGKDEPCIEIRSTGNRIMRMRLSAIRSIEERRVLVEMIKRYARRSVDKEDISQIVRVNKIQDIAFTQLWSNALQSHVPRITSAVLEKSSLLQDGKFLVKEQIGGGGQGAIYLAEMLDSAGQMTEVALKEYVLPDQEHLFDRKRATDQFEREVHLLTRLEHQSIIKLHDAFVEDHRAYLVMEYVQGETIKQITKDRGQLPEQETVELGLKLCNVLRYLHEQQPPVVHLDVTPDNIIIRNNGVLTLLDFNTSSDGSGLRTKLIAGKQRYMSPEQFRNEVDPLCDIYALGCTLFYMLTGVEPEPLTKCIVADYRSDVNPKLCQAIAQATELEKSSRCQSIAELEKTLKSCCGVMR